MENDKKQVIDTLKRYLDLSVTVFGKERRSDCDFEVEKRNPMYGGAGVVYMVSLFEKCDLVNNRIGVYMVLLNKGDQAGFHEHFSRKEQELYVIVNGEGKYIERIGQAQEIRTFTLKKGAVTAIQGENNYHSLINTGDEPLIVFVVSTYEK
jgi:oxalate decarboxylase/phosphoglucose isomerase-like protein (cupin superfamily)